MATCHWDFFLLPCQDSNLNYRDPESRVLPITPQGKIMRAKITKSP